jgi:hypothetical protein
MTKVIRRSLSIALFAGFVASSAIAADWKFNNGLPEGAENPSNLKALRLMLLI